MTTNVYQKRERKAGRRFMNVISSSIGSSPNESTVFMFCNNRINEIRRGIIQKMHWREKIKRRLDSNAMKDNKVAAIVIIYINTFSPIYYKI